MSVIEIAKRYLYVREEPKGSNRSTEIDRWLKDVNAPLGSPWCAAYIYGCLKEAGIAAPKKSGRVQDWVDAIDADKLLAANEAQAGDILVFWFESLKRYAHIGLVEGRTGTTLHTIEGNSIPQGGSGDSREGFGVFEHTLRASDRLKILRLG